MKLKISDIIIPPNRDRTEFDDKKLDQLAESIRLIGLIHPIVVDENNNLIAGESRIKAYERLGRTEIEATLKSGLEDWEKDFMELEENLRRKDLTPAEEAIAVEQFHKLHQKRCGRHTTLGVERRLKWRLQDTAQLLNLSLGSVSEQVKIGEAVRRDPELKKLTTSSAIKKAVKRKESTNLRIIQALLQKRKQKKPARVTGVSTQYELYENRQGIKVYNEDCIKVIPKLDDNSISCLITDPPWETRFDLSFMQKGEVSAIEFAGLVLQTLYPKLHDKSYCWMFCATKHLINGAVYDMIQNAGYRVVDLFIWYKPHVCHSSNPYLELKRDYEPCLLFSKGANRGFNHTEFAVHSETIKRQRIHPAEKPVGALEKMIKLTTVEGELIIDPFCGSGQTGVAAQNQKRRAILIEKDHGWWSTAVTEVG